MFIPGESSTFLWPRIHRERKLLSVMPQGIMLAVNKKIAHEVTGRGKLKSFLSMKSYFRNILRDVVVR